MFARAKGGLLAAVAAALFLVAACEKDPHDAQTWIDELDNPAKLDEAVRHLERLKNPRAIKPLGKLWQKMNRPTKVLRAIITIAGHKDKNTGKAQWADAVPFMMEAVEKFDPTDERSIDDAMVACDALGKAGATEAIPLLIATAQKPMPKVSPGNRVRIAAVRALGKFRDEKAVTVLINILKTNPEEQRLYLHAAAANAIAETGSDKALPTLVQALVQIGAIFTQVRTGITRVGGEQATQAMIDLLQEKVKESAILGKTEIARIMVEKKFDKKAPGVLIFKGALLLGDLRAKKAVPLLIEALKAEPRVSYFQEVPGQPDMQGEPGPSTHMAVLDALQRIGDPAAAQTVWEYATGAKTDDAMRPRAVDVYSWLAPDTSGLPQLYKWMTDENAEMQLRLASTMAYGRLARTKEDIAKLEKLLTDRKAEVAKLEAQVKAADDKLKGLEEAMKKAADDKAKGKVKEELVKIQGERDEADYKKQVAEMFQGTLQEARWRSEAFDGFEGPDKKPVPGCGTDAACYGKLLEAKDLSVGKPNLPRAERAAIELYKMGEKGKAGLPSILKQVETSERILREGVLLALPRVAPGACKECVDRLQQVMEIQAAQTTLDALNVETRIVYNYYLSLTK